MKFGYEQAGPRRGFHRHGPLIGKLRFLSFRVLSIQARGVSKGMAGPFDINSEFGLHANLMCPKADHGGGWANNKQI